ncbi:hypothetical protein Pelo_7035 [Pelomyxa schiedti]|nr:hypothetical protein Pelo_7035 [Pelomyxa schiedti]
MSASESEDNGVEEEPCKWLTYPREFRYEIGRHFAEIERHEQWVLLHRSGLILPCECDFLIVFQKTGKIYAQSDSLLDIKKYWQAIRGGADPSNPMCCKIRAIEPIYTPTSRYHRKFAWQNAWHSLVCAKDPRQVQKIAFRLGIAYCHRRRKHRQLLPSAPASHKRPHALRVAINNRQHQRCPSKATADQSLGCRRHLRRAALGQLAPHEAPGHPRPQHRVHLLDVPQHRAQVHHAVPLAGVMVDHGVLVVPPDVVALVELVAGWGGGGEAGDLVGVARDSRVQQGVLGLVGEGQQVLLEGEVLRSPRLVIVEVLGQRRNLQMS